MGTQNLFLYFHYGNSMDYFCCCYYFITKGLIQDSIYKMFLDNIVVIRQMSFDFREIQFLESHNKLSFLFSNGTAVPLTASIESVGAIHAVQPCRGRVIICLLLLAELLRSSLCLCHSCSGFSIFYLSWVKYILTFLYTRYSGGLNPILNFLFLNIGGEVRDLKHFRGRVFIIL